MLLAIHYNRHSPVITCGMTEFNGFGTCLLKLIGLCSEIHLHCRRSIHRSPSEALRERYVYRSIAGVEYRFILDVSLRPYTVGSVLCHILGGIKVETVFIIVERTIGNVGEGTVVTPSRVAISEERTLVGEIATIGQEVGVLVAEGMACSGGEVVVFRQHLCL